MTKDCLLSILCRVYIREISADDGFDELEDLIDRIKRLEDAGDRLAGATPPSSDRYMAWIKAKEAKS